MAGPIDLGWDRAQAEIAKQEAKLWESEWEIRVRCDAMSPIEAKELKKPENWDHDKQCDQDANKLASYFGETKGGHSACRRLLKYFHNKEKWVPGKMAKWYSLSFTLGKHLLLSERNMMTAGRDMVRPGVVECFCFSATYVMGAGCVHLRAPTSSVTVIAATLCPTCSVCLRCNKWPDFNPNGMSHCWGMWYSESTPRNTTKKVKLHGYPNCLPLPQPRHCRVAIEKAFGKDTLMMMIGASRCCTCTSAGLQGAWAHYHLEDVT